jgi:hypothetical protein
MLRTLLLALGLASASALVMPATRPVATLARAGSSPQMQADELHRKGHVVRIQIELEQGEPCVPHPPSAVLPLPRVAEWT